MNLVKIHVKDSMIMKRDCCCSYSDNHAIHKISIVQFIWPVVAIVHSNSSFYVHKYFLIYVHKLVVIKSAVYIHMITLTFLFSELYF